MSNPFAALAARLSSLRVTSGPKIPAQPRDVPPEARIIAAANEDASPEPGAGRPHSLPVTLRDETVGYVHILPADAQPTGIKTRRVNIYNVPLQLGDMVRRDGHRQVVVMKSLANDGEPTKSGKEDRIWRAFSHPNVLPFVGECTEVGVNKDATHYILSPHMKNGNLFDFLLNCPEICDESRLHCFTLDILAGIQYIHQQGYAHGDLKIDNILINDNLAAVVCDFGLSTELVRGENHIPTTDLVRSLGHIRYHSAEIIRRGLIVLDGSWLVRKPVQSGEPSASDKKVDHRPPGKSAPADMWAFGMIILHLYSGQWPWQEVAVDCDIATYIKAGLRPRFPGEFAGRKLTYKLWRHCWDCWETLPSHRPTAESLIRRLSDESRSIIASELSLTELSEFVRDEVILLTDEIAFDVKRMDETTRGDTTTFWSIWYPTEATSGTPVALKCYKDSTLSQEDGWSKTLLHEIFYWKQLRHHSLLPLIGVCMVDGVWHAVYPFMDPSTRSYRRHVELAERDRSADPMLKNGVPLRMLLDICDGLVFLHSQTPMFAHGAVRLDNVYIRTQNFRAANDVTIDACLENLRHVSVGDTAAAVKDLRDLGELVKEALQDRFHHFDETLPLLSNEAVARVLRLCASCDESSVPVTTNNIRAELALLVDNVLEGRL